MTKSCRCLRTVAAVASLLVPLSTAAPSMAGDLQLTLANGRVTLVARDVTVGEILAEWARVGQTTIVNAEKLTGGPVTLDFSDAPERSVLDALLRSAGGYMAATRPAPIAAASVYDRVIVMVTPNRVPAAAQSVVPPAYNAPTTPFAPAETMTSPFGEAFQGAEPSPFGVPGPSAAPVFLGTPGTEPQSFEPVEGDSTAERPYPSPFAQPPTPLLPSDGANLGTPPSAANPWGIPAGSASTPGVIVEPAQPQPGRTP